MKPRDLIVRCMVKREGDVWVAVCLDFMLAAQADSPEEARDKLHAQIDSYVREALSVDKEHAYELLTRKAPLRHRFAFEWACWWDRLRTAQKNVSSYCEPLPLQPVVA